VVQLLLQPPCGARLILPLYHMVTILSEKQQHWDEVTANMSRVTDKLGMPIDKGIFDTVVALNALGISTSMSCEGHLDHGRAAPWIRFHAKGSDQSRTQVKEATHQLERAKAEYAPTEEIQQWTRELFRLSQEADITCFQESKRVMDYLEIFYRDRHVPYNRQLVLKVDSFGNSTLTVHSEPFQPLHPLAVQAQNLARYQEEMQMFTAFLKQVYFGE
jgi:hypothetical protein